MKRIAAFVLVAVSTLTLAAEPPPSSSKAERFWPSWRGPSANGVSPYGDPPVEWSETKNIRWKVEIPGTGSSSPIVWEDRVFITTAVPTDRRSGRGEASPTPRRGMPVSEADSVHEFAVFALHRRDGRVLWRRSVREEQPHEGKHDTGTWASNSAVTDGKHVYAYFGSRGLYCLDMDGNLIWERDFGDMTKRMSFGEGSSPVVHEDAVFVLWDHQGQSFLFAVDKQTGRDIWKVSRDEITSWTTPLVVEQDGKYQIVTSATNQVRSYDAATGELIWHTGGMTLNPIPSPVAAGGMVFVTSGFRGSALLAVRLAEARGDITASDAIVWKHDRDTPYTPSPLLYDGTLYFLKSNSGVLSCFDAGTGKAHYAQQRLPGIGTVYSSPVGAAGRVYFTDRDGNTVVIRHGSRFEVLASNSLDDGFDASMAVVDDEIFLRGRKRLYCIARERAAASPSASLPGSLDLLTYNQRRK